MSSAEERNMSTTATDGTPLVIGASAGIGVVYADRLARRGHDLILVARTRSRLTALAQRLNDEAGRSVEYLSERHRADHANGCAVAALGADNF